MNELERAMTEALTLKEINTLLRLLTKVDEEANYDWVGTGEVADHNRELVEALSTVAEYAETSWHIKVDEEDDYS